MMLSLTRPLWQSVRSIHSARVLQTAIKAASSTSSSADTGNSSTSTTTTDTPPSKTTTDTSSPKTTTDTAPPTKIQDLDTSLVSKDLVAALTRAKFETLTPVQSRSLLPMFKEERGLVVRAKTGTGKTLAFIIPTLLSIIKGELQSRGRGPEENRVQTLVVAPTRDLAFQIQKEYNKVIEKLPPRFRNISTELCVGGKRSSFNLRRPSPILVATPGRLLDDLSNPQFRKLLSQIDHRVYDEADRLLEVGFQEELSQIDDILKSTREQSHPHLPIFKSILFSATVDKKVDQFAKEQIGPKYTYINCVSKEDGEAHENIHQTLVVTDNYTDLFGSALNLLVHKMKTEAWEPEYSPKRKGKKNDTVKEDLPKSFKCLVFLPTIAASEWIFLAMRSARANGLFRNRNLFKLNGKMTQNARDKAVNNFKHAKSGLLVCTDVAARGLDFSDVTHVVQLAPSPQIADYIHKVGRTARAGNKGEAIIFLAKPEVPFKTALVKQRGIKFAEEHTTESYAEKQAWQPVDDVLFTLNQSSVEEVDTMVLSYIGHVKQVCSTYRLPFEGLFRDVVLWYQNIVGDNTALPPYSMRLLRNMGVPEHMARAMCDGGAAYFADPSNFNYEARNSSRNDRYNNSNRNDRYGNNRYGNNRYGNNRYGNNGNRYGDKNYGNRFSNDRRSSNRFDDYRNQDNGRRFTGKFQGSRREY